MEERYEIRGKIGQGGLGSVYRAWDRSLKREVAIKRILTSDDDKLGDEATRQMEQETGALAALQHPHVVTIYDVGTDEDGPFVVMEQYIKGETIDQIIERAPLTGKDFREFALQVQEGLIAAQDLGILHRDLKPSNVMLNWLPSGKFQVKIVDFGLAKFSSQPSLQTVDHSDSIYGSIFFMAPEQFERAPIDARTDMYAIGCVYYFTLAGVTPYQGETGPQVMASHLQHLVTPLAELRPDLPSWICDWVMWHINRQPLDRPEHAREALQNFIELDQPLTQSMPSHHTQPVSADGEPKRPRLIIPGATPAPAQPAPEPEPVQESPAVAKTAPQPLLPPTDAPPSLHATAQHPPLEPQPEPTPAPASGSSRLVIPGAAATAATGAATSNVNAPSSVPVTASQPPAVASVTTAPVASQAAATPATTIGGPRTKSKKKGLSGSAKIAIGSVTALLALVVGYLIVDRVNTNKVTARYNEMVALADNARAEEIPVNARDLEILLDSTRLGGNVSRETVYKALSMAEAIDDTDVDARIAEFATTEPLPEDIRVSLLSRVIRRRADPSVTPLLLDFARNSPDEKAAAAAITAITDVGGEQELAALLDVIRQTGSAEIRKSAERAVASIIRDSVNREKHGEPLARHYQNANITEIRHTYLRLLGIAGGDRAEEIVTSALQNDDTGDTLAAIQALREWPDESLFPNLVEFISNQTGSLRDKAFDAAFVFMTGRSHDFSPSTAEELWKSLAAESKTEREQYSLVSGIAQTRTDDWAIELVREFTDDEHPDRVIDRAEKAIDHINEQRKVKGEN